MSFCRRHKRMLDKARRINSKQESEERIKELRRQGYAVKIIDTLERRIVLRSKFPVTS